MENFKISHTQSLKDVTELLDRMQLTELNKKMRIKLNTHPGFLTTITLLQISTSGNLKIEVENIDNIYYLDHVEKMIDSLIRILQNKKTEPITNIPHEEIEKLILKVYCLGIYRMKAKAKKNMTYHHRKHW